MNVSVVLPYVADADDYADRGTDAAPHHNANGAPYHNANHYAYHGERLMCLLKCQRAYKLHIASRQSC